MDFRQTERNLFREVHLGGIAKDAEKKQLQILGHSKAQVSAAGKAHGLAGNCT